MSHQSGQEESEARDEWELAQSWQASCPAWEDMNAEGWYDPGMDWTDAGPSENTLRTTNDGQSLSLEQVARRNNHGVSQDIPTSVIDVQASCDYTAVPGRPPQVQQAHEGIQEGATQDLTENEIRDLIGTMATVAWNTLVESQSQSSAGGTPHQKSFRNKFRNQANLAISDLPDRSRANVQAILDRLGAEMDLPLRRKAPPSDPEGRIATLDRLMPSVFTVLAREGLHCPPDQRAGNWRRSITTSARQIWSRNPGLSAEDLAQSLLEGNME